MEKIKYHLISYLLLSFVVVSCSEYSEVTESEYWAPNRYKIKVEHVEIAHEKLTVNKYYDQNAIDSLDYNKEVSFYENGQVYSVCFYKDKIKVGNWKQWYKNGNLALSENYEDGELNGLYQSWFENGDVLEVITYKKGQVVN